MAIHKHFALTVLVALVSNLSCFAHDFEAVYEGKTIYYKITSSENFTCAVTYQGKFGAEIEDEYSGRVVIPSSVIYGGKTYSVTSINSSTFTECTSLTSVQIPESVTSIGYSAFSHCSNLQSVEIPNSVTTIGSHLFWGCI